MADQPTAPAVETPAVAPAAASSPVPTPAAEPPKPAEPAPATAPEAPKAAEPSSLIGEAKPPEPAPATTPAEAKAADEPPKVEAPKVEEPKAAEPAKAAEPKSFEYKPFTYPEGFTPDTERVKSLQDIVTAASPNAEVAQETAQKLIDLYTAEVNRFTEGQAAIWSKTQNEWRDQVRADPEVGGNRLDTALQTCATVIDNYGGSAEEKAQLRQVLNYTGAGNHPIMVRFLHRIGKALGEGRPVPAPKPVPPPTGRSQRRYAGGGTQQS